MLDSGHGKYMLHFIWNFVRESVPKKEQIDNDSLMKLFTQTIDPKCLQESLRKCYKEKQTAKKVKMEIKAF